ncbi:hypothetical protein LAV72_18680 [Lysinibacillus xylanilyticus]|uniref:hypothetical protein n=1 Tax=Lysinibacillus xylanilyticus TaxID=582475 RepID=UPI002B246BF3|nr:hypothetical protein [Lysinibacillus xylanilyticus]MEB2301633.1 hypothetical protein [Lysinibacillus xylanilyticus]
MFQIEFKEGFFKLITAILLLSGYFLIFLPVYLPYLKRWQLNHMRKQRGSQSTQGKIFKTVTNMLETAYGKATPNMVYSFLLIMVTLYVVVAVTLMINSFSILSALTSAAILPAMVYGYLSIRIYKNRVKISFEGTVAINELTNNYRIQHRNLIEALEYTSNELTEKAPLMRALFLNMTYRLRDAQSEVEIRESIAMMGYTVQTSWAHQLVNLFNIAVIKGEDITDGLIEVANDLSRLEELNEFKKRENNQSRMMLYVLSPLLLVGSAVALFTLFDFTFEKYISYQFQSPIGFKMFFFMIVSFTGAILMYKLFTQSKNDF